MIATAGHWSVGLPQIQLCSRSGSRMRTVMTTQIGMRSLAILGAAFAAAQMSFAQEIPNRVAWSPSYSGSCTDCSLVGRNMSGWNISKANYPGADLTAASLRRAQGHDANFSGAQATGVDLRNGDFTGASFEDAILVGASLQDAMFNNSKMSGVVLTGANLSDGKFIGAILSDAQLQSGVVHNADFSAATLSGARFEAADLTGSVFDNAILLDADFSGATVTDASFRDVRFSGANLEAAIGIETANFEGACASPVSRLPVGLTLPDCLAY